MEARSEVIIKPMSKADIDFVISANAVINKASHQSGKVMDLKSRLYSDVLSDKPKAAVVIAEVGGESVGMALYSTTYFTNEGEIMWLSQIYVEEYYRNHGVAGKILDYLWEICEKNDYYAICGAVAQHNEDSISFFEKSGVNWLDDFTVFSYRKDKE
jgi:L-amino acid N-acyltransferase YncA